VAAPSRLVLDIRLPGPSGLAFQAELAKANIQIPIIFMTGHGDIPMTVKAMKAGPSSFLRSHFAIKIGWMPFESRRSAIEKDEKSLANLRSRFETLNPREREVAAWVGLLNKQITAEVGLAETPSRSIAAMS
jgi:FixJ family two-component response regulator